MKRIAAHYLYCLDTLFRMHYVELNDKGLFVAHHPLESELPSTEFHDGILLVVPMLPECFSIGSFEIDVECEKRSASFYSKLPTFFEKVTDLFYKQSVSNIYLLQLRGLTPSELGTDYSRCHCYIKRF